VIGNKDEFPMPFSYKLRCDHVFPRV
jgi:hypothetical protein